MFEDDVPPHTYRKSRHEQTVSMLAWIVIALIGVIGTIVVLLSLALRHGVI
jgi:hypothetical protein